MPEKTDIQCPVCGWPTLPIVYGLPADRDAKRTDVILGGCLIEEGNPDLACGNCDWSGQEWHIYAPLPPSIWIIQDPKGFMAPMGLVAARFDEVLEVFQFGRWYEPKSTQHYQDWFDLAPGEALILTSPYAEQSRDLIAEFRIGRLVFEPSDLYASGFQGLVGGAPRFDFNGRMEPMGR